MVLRGVRFGLAECLRSDERQTTIHRAARPSSQRLARGRRRPALLPPRRLHLLATQSRAHVRGRCAVWAGRQMLHIASGLAWAAFRANREAFVVHWQEVTEG